MTKEEAITISIIIGAMVTPWAKNFFIFIKSLFTKPVCEYVTRAEFNEKCKELKQDFANEFNAVEGKLSALDLKVDTNHNQVMGMLLQIQQGLLTAIMGEKK